MWLGFVGDPPPGSTVGSSPDETPDENPDNTGIPAPTPLQNPSPLGADRKRPGLYSSKGTKASWGISLLIHGGLLITAVLVARYYWHDSPKASPDASGTPGVVLRSPTMNGVLSWRLSTLGAGADETDLTKWPANPALAQFPRPGRRHLIV